MIQRKVRVRDHKPKQKPDTNRQLRELRKMVREIREGKVPPEQRDEHAKEFQKRSDRLSQDLSDEIERLVQRSRRKAGEP